MNEDELNELIYDWKNEFNASLFSSSSFCVALFNIEGTLLFANKAMLLLFNNNSKESLINPTFEKVLTLDNSNTLIFEGFITIGKNYSINSSIDAKVFRKNNKILILGGADSSLLLVQNENMHHLNREIGNLQRKLIQEKKLLENTLKELNNTNLQLQELNATKDKFFSIIAHDLISPFSSILGISEILSKNASIFSTEKIEMIAKNMHHVSKNTFSLLENLLEWSRLQNGKLKPLLIEVDYYDIARNVKMLCEPIALSKNITLELELDSSVLIIADKQMLNTLLRNLITNALKFTHPEGTVKIVSENRDNEVLFMVTDTGIGIEPEYLNNLFSINCNLSNNGTANEKGTGLGLILCKEFVEKQNGKIWVESTLGKGSSFKFLLPRY